MKFDVTIGNPPYNKGLLKGIDNKVSLASGYPHLFFIEKLSRCIAPNGTLTYVIPASLMTLTSLGRFRKWLLGRYSVDWIKIYNNSNKKYFDINKFDNVIAISISNKPYTGNTVLVREDLGYNIEECTVDLRTYTYWPLYFGQAGREIFDRVQSFRSQDIPWLDKNKTENYISFAAMGDGNSYNHTKRWTLDSRKESIRVPINLYFKTSQQSKIYYKFTQTKLFNYLLSMTKSTPKNQPQCINFIGDFGFVNSDFYAYFGLTTEQINTVEAYENITRY
jgi:hypothetical protein